MIVISLLIVNTIEHRSADIVQRSRLVKDLSKQLKGKCHLPNEEQTVLMMRRIMRKSIGGVPLDLFKAANEHCFCSNSNIKTKFYPKHRFF